MNDEEIKAHFSEVGMLPFICRILVWMLHINMNYCERSLCKSLDSIAQVSVLCVNHWILSLLFYKNDTDLDNVLLLDTLLWLLCVLY